MILIKKILVIFILFNINIAYAEKGGQITKGDFSPIINSGGGDISVSYSKTKKKIKEYDLLKLLDLFLIKNEKELSLVEVLRATSSINWQSKAGYLGQRSVDIFQSDNLIGKQGKVKILLNKKKSPSIWDVVVASPKTDYSVIVNFSLTCFNIEEIGCTVDEIDTNIKKELAGKAINICPSKKTSRVTLFSYKKVNTKPIYFFVSHDEGSSGRVNFSIAIVWDKPKIDKYTCNYFKGSHFQYVISSYEGAPNWYDPFQHLSFNPQIKGVILDNRRMLMWKRCPEGLFGDNCTEGEIEFYSAAKSLKVFYKGTQFAGYIDWRLPKLDELSSLIDCGNDKFIMYPYNKNCNDKNINFDSPALDNFYFPYKGVLKYWTSKKGTIVNFSDGSVLNSTNKNAVLLVRKWANY